jgi:hypothetical protein
MKEPKFKVGDWCYYEFELHQVKETEEDRITSVTDGYFETGNRDHSKYCFPVDMKIKTTSDEALTWYRDICKEAKLSNINNPGIRGRLVDIWVKLCENKDNDKEYKKYWTELQSFGNQVISKIRDINHEQIDGIRIIRP